MPEDAAKPMSRKLIALLAVGCGATVANLYYAQPLLAAIGADFGVSDGTAGLLVTVSQIVYGFGLVFLAPLSDLVDRRKLVVVLLIVSGVAMAGAAVAPQFLCWRWRSASPRPPRSSPRSSSRSPAPSPRRANAATSSAW